MLSTRTLNKTQLEKIQVYKNKILEIIERSKGVVSSFSNSSKLCERLIEKQKEAFPKETPLKLIQEVITRWQSLFVCLARVKLQHSLISEIIMANQRKHKKIVQYLLCEEEIIQLRHLLDFLHVFADANEMLSGESYVTCVIILPLIKALKNSCQLKIGDSEYITF